MLVLFIPQVYALRTPTLGITIPIACGMLLSRLITMHHSYVLAQVCLSQQHCDHLE